MSEKTLAALHARLAPLAVKTSRLAVPPPRETRFGSCLALSHVHYRRIRCHGSVSFRPIHQSGDRREQLIPNARALRAASHSPFPVRAASRSHDRVQPQKETPMTLSLVTTKPADPVAHHRPKFILLIGSGRSGKSFWSRWFVERAAERGAPLDIYDADPLSPPAAGRFDHGLRFGLQDQDWLEKKIIALAEARRSLILDPGPMLFGLIEWFTALPVAESVEEYGLDFVAVYLLTPDPDSLPRLPYFLNLIKPPRAVIVLNEWRISADDAANAFADIIADPRVVAARADGARIITMPHRPLPKHLTALRPQYDPEWLHRMEDNFAPVAAWFD
jgi:hypothetical protein